MWAAQFEIDHNAAYFYAACHVEMGSYGMVAVRGSAEHGHGSAKCQADFSIHR
jgi:hypothetical protein